MSEQPSDPKDKFLAALAKKMTQIMQNTMVAQLRQKKKKKLKEKRRRYLEENLVQAN